MADAERTPHEGHHGERRRERAPRESGRDRMWNREKDRDRGKVRRYIDVNEIREKDTRRKDGGRRIDRDQVRVRDRSRELERERQRGHDCERWARDYGGDRCKKQSPKSRSSSRGRSRDVSTSRSRSRSRSRKESASDRAAPGAVDRSTPGSPGIRFQAARNGNLFWESQTQQPCKVAVDGTVGSNPSIDSQQSIEVRDGEMRGNKSPAIPLTKSGKSSKWGPAPFSEDAVLAEVANDFEAAKVAAIRAAELVNKNLRVAGLMSADHKKKLLWGGKKTQVEQEPTLAAAGTNRWDTVHFSDRDRMEKFHKLMGVKGETKVKEALLPATGTAIFTEENQKALQDELEKQFTQGLRRRDGRTVGLGL